jgi:hypothetical protein
MLAVPRKGDCSKVSIELSRYIDMLARLPVVVCSVIFSVTHVERRKVGAVLVEGLVVVLGELLCTDEVSINQAEV